MLRRHRITLALLSCVVLVAPTLASAGEGHMSFTEAQAQAKERGVPIVVDFFTDWCVYCKHFDRDLALEETGIAKALGDVVFTSIDAEKGEGIELAKNFGVTGFPTYIVTSADAEMIDRWSGYGGPEHFLDAFKSALADPVTVAEKRARFEKEPNARDAQTLARMAAAEGDNVAAIVLYEKAQMLDSNLDLGSDILVTAYYGMRGGSMSTSDFMTYAKKIGLGEDASVENSIMAMRMVDGVASSEGGTPEMRLPFLERAVKIVARNPEGLDEGTRQHVALSKALHLDRNVEKAVEIRKSMMPEGWKDSASELNSFAWWCFEQNINLEEAEQLARHGVEIAQPGKTKAMILDTAAEICNARGDCRDAVTLIELAISEDPENETYKQQLDRFQKILASSN